jgi:acyl-CoA synthetase (AMP-forming)/AMP-acid ligase II
MLGDRFPRQEVRARLFDDYRARGLWGTRTFDRVLEEGCNEKWPDAEFVVASPTRPASVTYREMHARGRHLSGALYALGLRRGDVIALEMPNWMEACLTYLAAAHLGLIVVPIIHIYKAKEVEFILRQSGAKAFVIPDTWSGIDYLATLSEIRDRLPGLEHVIVVGDKVPDDAIAWPDLEARGSEEFPTPDISPDEPHVLAYTSGTTADPKGCVHSHNTLLAECRAIVASSAGGPSDVFLCPNPIGHIAGIYSALIAPFLLGYRKLVLMDGWDPKWALELIEEHEVTRTGGASFFLATMLGAPELATIDTSSLESFGLGGANVMPMLVEQAETVGWRGFRSYGCTEHPSITMGSPDTDPLDKREYTDGRAMLDVELRLVDDDGRDVPQGEEGEVISRGPDQFLGYMDPAMDAEAFDADGWFHTGDIGRLDADGYLAITDRKKDIIIRGGENISAREVEEVLATHPNVLEAAVTPVPDERYGERVCAFVVTGGKDLTLDEVIAHFEEQGVAKQKTPERLEIVPELPRTLAGKVQKYVLKRRLDA